MLPLLDNWDAFVLSATRRTLDFLCGWVSLDKPRLLYLLVLSIVSEFDALFTHKLTSALDTTAFLLACAVLYLAGTSNDGGHRGRYRKTFLARIPRPARVSVPAS